MKKINGSAAVAAAMSMVLVLFCGRLSAQDEKVDMKEVRQMVKMPVNESLEGVPVKPVPIKEYWRAVKQKRKHKRPVVAFFYSNVDPESQRVASLLKYVAEEYDGKMIFIRVQTAHEGKPDKEEAANLEKEFSLDKTPGVLFYDNVKDEMVLEDEDYVDADFREFRSPSLFLWKTYYKVIRRELNKLLSD